MIEILNIDVLLFIRNTQSYKDSGKCQHTNTRTEQNRIFIKDLSYKYKQFNKHVTLS